MFTELITDAQQYLTPADVQRVKDAYHFAEAAHKTQKRKSGEPYIQHPVEVATILSHLKQDADTLCAALLHDVLEDTPATEEVLKLQFGPQVLFLVDGVTKLTEIKIGARDTNLQAENIRKMFLAMAKDIRIVFIKLADRLHNMRTLEHLSRAKQIENAQETMDIYAPLAHRLGLGLIKWELEDLSFRYLEPEKFNEIREKVAERRRERDDYIQEFMKAIRKVLKDHELVCDVSGRAKHFYSIYRKMTTQKLEFDEIYDLSAIRILAKSDSDCYSVLGLIHSQWKPIQGKIKDYIAMPKDNMYQSLHTTVMGPEGKLVEIQIRTYEMHQFAEYGIASHWLYKETDKTKAGKKRLKQKDLEYIEKMTWLRKLGEEGLEGQEFMDNLKNEVLFEEVYVYTPKGDVYSLSQGATPVDFAYHIHSAVGNTCVGAKVNNRIVSLNSELKNGDIVEILTRKDATPKSDWLSFVKSARTKSKIKSWISKQNRTQHLETGQEQLANILKEETLDLSLLEEKQYREVLLKRYAFEELDDLYVGIGHGDLSARAVAHTIQEIYREKHPIQEQTLTETLPEISARPKKSNKVGISVAGVDTIMLKVANCCHPVPGDQIVGFVTMGYGITVHRTDCHNIKNQTERKIEVFWNNSAKHKYATVIEIVGFDRVGLFKDLLNVVSDQNTNIIEATAKKTGKGEFKTLLTVEVNDLQHLLTIMSSLKKVKDVYDAHRQKS